MKIEFLKAADDMAVLKEKLEKIMDKVRAESFEDEIAKKWIESAFEKLDMATYKISHYSKPSLVGTLAEMDNGKFELISSGKSITYFSCGSPIECYIDDEWYAGRVEHKEENGQRGYYFYCGCAGNPFLYTGMRARIRKD